MAVSAQPQLFARAVRRVVFWCHLAVALVAATMVLVMSATGVLLTYQRQIEAWTDIREYGLNTAPSVSRLAADTLVAAVRATDPAPQIDSLTVYRDRRAPVWVAAGPRTFAVDPYTGRVLGEGPTAARGFFRTVIDWHRWWGVSGTRRATAKMAVDAGNLLFLFLLMSGFYLWFPRGWTRPQLSAITWFKRGLPGKARDFNWHNTIGFWTVLPLLVIVTGGVVISYTWASDLVFRAAGEAPPVLSPPVTAPVRSTAASASLEAMLAAAERQVEGWRSIAMRLPSPGSAVAVFVVDAGTGGQPQKRGTLTLSTASASVVKWEPFEALTQGRRWRSYMRWLHSGEVAGVGGQTIAGLASLGAVVLVWTGLSLAFRRLIAWRGRRMAAVRRAA